MPIYILFTLTVNILKKLPFTFQFIGCHFILASYFLKQNIHDFTCRKEEKVREYGCWTFLILYSSCFCSPVGSTWHLNNVETDLLCKWGLREQKRRWDEKTPKYFQMYWSYRQSSLAWSKERHRLQSKESESRLTEVVGHAMTLQGFKQPLVHEQPRPLWLLKKSLGPKISKVMHCVLNVHIIFTQSTFHILAKRTRTTPCHNVIVQCVSSLKL